MEGVGDEGGRGKWYGRGVRGRRGGEGER